MSAGWTWLAVALLGGVGAVVRVVVTTVVAAWLDAAGHRPRLPLGTFAVNVSGSALLGLLAGLVLDRDAWLIAAGGLLGSYTTFSTWMVDSERLAARGTGRAAAVNVLGSLAVGFAALALGHALGSALN